MFSFCKLFFKSSHFFSVFNINHYFCFFHFFGILFFYSSYYTKLFLFFIKPKPSHLTENIVVKNIPYEKKYVEEFDNSPCNVFDFSDEVVAQKFKQLVCDYQQKLYSLQEEYAELQSIYDNSDSDDDNSFENDHEIKLLKEKIVDLQCLLKNKSQITKNAKNLCFEEAKLNLMKSMQNNFIIENTHIGNVIMVYNFKKEGFSYYSDKSIANKYLESVCRKYCIQFKCKILFNNVFINEGKLSQFKFLKNEVKNKIKKHSNLSFRSFKEHFSLF